ncbi:DUF6460 domain-containing protein [Bartonella sp. B17]
MNKKKNTSNSLHSFFRSTLGHVAIKLLTLSFLVGIVMNFFEWTPRSLIRKIIKFLWETGFATFFTNLFHITVTGAVIVVPIFLLLRIFCKKRKK